ncbi:MAG: N-6 DNA methylase, partial [Terriglobia bacterium]
HRPSATISPTSASAPTFPNMPAASRSFNCWKDLLLDAAPQFLVDYLQGMEHSLGGPKTALFSRGRVDALYGNLVIEFKRSLSKSLEDAKEQLARYLGILLSSPEDRQRPLIALATDGIQFVAYAPRFPVETAKLGPEDISLVEIERGSLESMTPEAAYYWLDRYFTRQTGPITPKTKQIVEDFGPASGSFIHAMNVLNGLWKSVARDSESQVFYDSWQKYLRITYGGPVAEEELFLRHTYLATLAKLMVWVRLTGSTEPPNNGELRSVLNGHYFSQRGIQNFLEEDFFAWVARDAAWPQALIMSRRLLLQLATYNLAELSEDVLKGLYERLVDPKDRHDLGEYYTPDWLAAKVVRECLEEKPDASVLDPACGSGTFLYQAILFKRDALGDSAKTLKHIEANVCGMDIHPLAVIVAKTTYLLALGKLVAGRKKALRIPVYLADSIKPPDRYFAGFRAALNGDTVNFPEDLALDAELYDPGVELCSQYADATADAALPSEPEFRNYLGRNQPALAAGAVWVQALYELFKVLRNKIKDRKDTIWAFVLKNVFKPILLKDRFEVLVGNPPWLSYRYVEKGEYQEFLKAEITKHYGLLTGRPELLTHMELGTLFFVRSADFYLHDGGRIAFVLPKSIFVADQHHAFRQGNHAAGLRLTQAWDLEGVRPLFNVPAAVAFGEKGTAQSEWPSPGRILSGELSGKNVPLA